MWHAGDLKLRRGGNPEISKGMSDFMQGTLRYNGTGSQCHAFPNKLGKSTLFLSKSDQKQRRNECPLVETCTAPGDGWHGSPLYFSHILTLSVLRWSRDHEDSRLAIS